MMRRGRAWWPSRPNTQIATIAGALLAGALTAQDESTGTERIRVQVSSVAGGNVYFDAGRRAGLRPGMEVQIRPQQGAPFVVTLLEVSSSSARARLPQDAPAIDTATFGEATVDRSRASRQDPESVEPRRAERTPDHPPWTWDDYPTGETENPLLAPAFGGGPESRPIDVSGRVFWQTIYARDESDGRGFESYRSRVGARIEVKNLFGAGGRLRFSGQANQRSLELFDTGADSETRVRLDQLSYASSDADDEPWRYEFGRFISQHVPEVGVLDGVEVVRRLSDELSVGVGAGLFPLHFRDRDTGDDAGFDAFVTWQDEHGNSSATAGYQKTWHRGNADRDAIFGRFDLGLTEDLRVDGSGFFDIYTSDDTLKDQDIELTRGFVGVRWTPLDCAGVSVNASTYRWAELLREDLAFAPVSLIQDGHVERLSPRVWVDLTDDLRLTGRTDIWRDQQGDGQSSEAGFSWGDIFGSNLDVAASGFYSDGTFTSGPGARARIGRNHDWGYTGARYEWSRFLTSGLLGGDSPELVQHRVGLDVNVDLADGWSLLVNGDWIQGDQQDSYNLGLYVQWRF